MTLSIGQLTESIFPHLSQLSLLRCLVLGVNSGMPDHTLLLPNLQSLALYRISNEQLITLSSFHIPRAESLTLNWRTPPEALLPSPELWSYGQHITLTLTRRTNCF